MSFEEFKIEVSSLEVYCETVRDLISDHEIQLRSDQNRRLVIQGQKWI